MYRGEDHHQLHPTRRSTSWTTTNSDHHTKSPQITTKNLDLNMKRVAPAPNLPPQLAAAASMVNRPPYLPKTTIVNRSPPSPKTTTVGLRERGRWSASTFGCVGRHRRRLTPHFFCICWAKPHFRERVREYFEEKEREGMQKSVIMGVGV